jgi:hypothetical protein
MAVGHATQSIFASVLCCVSPYLDDLARTRKADLPCSSSVAPIRQLFAEHFPGAVARQCCTCMPLSVDLSFNILQTKKPSPSGRVHSRLVALEPHLLSLTTLPGEAGWYGQSPCLDVLIDFDVVFLDCQQL